MNRIPLLFQRLEGAVLFAAATYLYIDQGNNILVYIGLWLAIDLFMAGYLFGNKIGAIVYNVGHSLAVPAILAAVGFATNTDALLGLSCIWFSHIGLDRALGYGLKEADGFQHTHLGIIGKKK